jgi:hypothetical protein
MSAPLVPVTLYRDDWPLLLGWLTAKQDGSEWEPAFMAKATAAIKDAVEE